MAECGIDMKKRDVGSRYNNRSKGYKLNKFYYKNSGSQFRKYVGKALG